MPLPQQVCLFRIIQNCSSKRNITNTSRECHSWVDGGSTQADILHAQLVDASSFASVITLGADSKNVLSSLKSTRRIRSSKGLSRVLILPFDASREILLGLTFSLLAAVRILIHCSSMASIPGLYEVIWSHTSYHIHVYSTTIDTVDTIWLYRYNMIVTLQYDTNANFERQ